MGRSRAPRRNAAQGLSGGEWLGVVVLPAVILIGVYVVLWANLTDAKAAFDFAAGRLTIEHKGLCSFQLTEVPLKEIAAVRTGANVTPPPIGTYGTGTTTFFLNLTFLDGVELRLFETADERVADDAREIIQKRLELAVG